MAKVPGIPSRAQNAAKSYRDDLKKRIAAGAQDQHDLQACMDVLKVEHASLDANYQLRQSRKARLDFIVTQMDKLDEDMESKAKEVNGLNDELHALDDFLKPPGWELWANRLTVS